MPAPNDHESEDAPLCVLPDGDIARPYCTLVSVLGVQRIGKGYRPVIGTCRIVLVDGPAPPEYADHHDG